MRLSCVRGALKGGHRVRGRRERGAQHDLLQGGCRGGVVPSHTLVRGALQAEHARVRRHEALERPTATKRVVEGAEQRARAGLNNAHLAATAAARHVRKRPRV